MPEVIRSLLRRSTRLGHQCSAAVGFFVITGALALWFQPSWRGAIAERVMPLLSAAPGDNAAAISLLATLQSHASPSGAPAALRTGIPSHTLSNVALGAGGGPAMGPFGAPLDPKNLPSVVRLAQPIQIVADARYDRPTPSTRDESKVARYIAQRYRVAQEPIDVLVHAAYQTGHDVGLDPLLLLAVMAVESGFNPYAESGVGARGLMQVMPLVHSDKFKYYGGPQAALEPMPNLRVGALILKEYIGRTGSIAQGLRWYVGAAAASNDGGYGAKVLAERQRLRDAIRANAAGKNLVTANAASTTAPSQPS